jgi:hypothetical protein
VTLAVTEMVLAIAALNLAAAAAGWAVRRDGFVSLAFLGALSLVLCNIIWVMRLA